MANFSGNINLLAMKGAKVFSGLDAAHPHLNYVYIPCSYNDIELSSDGKYANVGIYMQETNEKFRQALWRREYERLMALQKEELVKLIIGELPWLI